MDIDRDPRGRQYKTYWETMKNYDKQQKQMVRCKCSHTMLFSGRKDRLCCTYCGHWVYKDKATEIKYKMKEYLR